MENFSVIPPELLMLIVSFAAASCPRTATKLSLVSRQVQSWSDPHIFRNIVIEDDCGAPEQLEEDYELVVAEDASPRLLRARTYVRTFSSRQSDTTESQFCKFFSLCPNLFSIAFWEAPLPLDMASLSFPTLRRMAFQETKGLSLESLLFKTVTHLDLVGWTFSRLPDLGVKRMTSLTHLMLSSWSIDTSHDEEELLKGAAPCLRLLILRLNDDYPMPAGDLRKYVPCVLPVASPEEYEDEDEDEGEKKEVEKEEVPGIPNFDVCGDKAFKEWCGKTPEEDSFWLKAEKLLESLRKLEE
ncbi:hypothetical protein DL96DRAFT_1621944 [Flagelloscypha sp. PMI_526]|nr:hypothetical protein DL96DRAFT_1621944 [Flagelloscypha sp. PMI_526]